MEYEAHVVHVQPSEFWEMDALSQALSDVGLETTESYYEDDAFMTTILVAGVNILFVVDPQTIDEWIDQINEGDY